MWLFFYNTVVIQDINWLPESDFAFDRLSQDAKTWLLSSGSLSVQLEAYCHEHFAVQVVEESTVSDVVQQHWPVIQAQNVFAREVLLSVDSKPWVFGRSLMPESVVNKDPQLAKLGSKPLGSLLFRSDKTTRGSFEIAIIPASSWLGIKVNQYYDIAAKHLVARRSLFSYMDEPIALIEVFLPNSPVTVLK